MNLDDFENSGWKTDELAAFVSLQSAIQSYFETYQSISSSLSLVDFKKIRERTNFDIPEYRIKYFMCIAHFQHFFELILKDVLEKINPLFSIRMKDENIVGMYCKIKEIDNPKFELYSVEFSDALKRLLKIIEFQKEYKHNEALLDEFSFLKQKKKTLQKINSLRNRIWHKGLFYLSYHSFDWFIGHEVFPLVDEIFATTLYSEKKNLWSYKSLDCGIDPIHQIIGEFKRSEEYVDYEKIALLKEMGRAAYRNPLVMKDMKICDDKENCLQRSLVRKINRDVMKEKNVKVKNIEELFPCSRIYKCPVCGQKTLVKFMTVEYGDVRDGRGVVSQDWMDILDRYECQTCSFRINPNIRNLSVQSSDGNEIWCLSE